MSEFLTQATIYLAAAVIAVPLAARFGLGSVLAPLAGQEGVQASPPVQKAGISAVPTRPFGRSGIDVPILSLGGMFDIPSNQTMLKQAIRWGVTYWDTAHIYGGGRSEEGIGEYFKSYPQDRKKIFLVTKSTARSPKGMSSDLEVAITRGATIVRVGSAIFGPRNQPR